MGSHYLARAYDLKFFSTVLEAGCTPSSDLWPAVDTVSCALSLFLWRQRRPSVAATCLRGVECLPNAAALLLLIQACWLSYRHAPQRFCH